MSKLRVSVFVMAIVLFTAISGWAQVGVITGRVSDTSSAVLPSVGITLTSPAIMGERTAVSDEQGSYRLTLLPSGSYSLKFELPGFKTLIREGIQITAGFTATLNVSLDVANVGETVTVVGESPIVDVQSTSLTKNFSAEVSSILPTAHDMWSILGISPGIQVTTPDVGGSRAHIQSNYRTYGTSGQNWISYDGVITTQGTSAASFYYDNDAFGEMQVNAASKSADVPTPGANINLIVKTGSNTLHGTGYLDWEPLKLEGTNLTEQLKQQGFKRLNGRARWVGLHGDVGGPFIKDKFWWYTSVRELKNDLNLIGFKLDNGTEEVFRTTLENLNVKFNYQATPKNTVTYTGALANKYQPWRVNTSNAQFWTVESAGIQDNPSWIDKYQLTSILSPRMTLEVKLANFGFKFPTVSRTNEISRRDLDTQQVRGGYSGENLGLTGSNPFIERRRRWHFEPILAFNTSGSRIGNHDFKIGYGDLYESRRYSILATRDSVITYWRGGFARPASIDTFDTPFADENSLRQHWLFVNDTWHLAQRLTFNLGFRYDRYMPYYPKQGKLGIGPYQQKVTFERFAFAPLSGPVPRLGVVYDVFGNGRTAIKASYSVYRHNTGEVLAEQVNPMSLTRKRYNWDGKLPFVPDPAQLVSTTGGVNRSVDPNLKLPYTPEYTFGINQQVMKDMTVNVNVVHKLERNKWQLLNKAIPYSAYNIPVNFTDPGRDGQIGTGDDRPLTVFSLDPKFRALRQDLLTNDPANASTFRSYEFEAVKRFSNKWQVLTGVDITHFKTWDQADIASDVGGVPQDPNNRMFNVGRNYWHWQFKLIGSYELPYGLTVSGSQRMTKGEPFGRTLNTPSLNQGVATLTVEPVGTFFYPTVRVLDMRLTKTFKFHENHKVDAILDVFNALNSAATLSQSFLTGATFGRILETLPPRIGRLAVRYVF